MPSNDTENIYATQYGGEGEPIPSTKISYDNTDSGLTADDVQEAIDEVVGKIGNLTAANVAYDNTTSGLTADDVQEAIDEVALVTTKTSNHMLLKPSGTSLLNYTIDVTTDGVKTWAEVLHDLYTAFHTVITALPDGRRVRPAAIFIQGYGGFLSTYTSGFTNATVDDTSYYEGAHVSASAVYACNVQLGETSTFVEWLIDGTGATRTLKTTDVPDSGKKVYLNYELYDKV